MSRRGLWWNIADRIMKIRRIITLSSIALIFAALCAGNAIGQTPKNAGTVTAIDLTAKTLSIVREDKTSVAVAVSDATTIKRLPLGATSLEDAVTITLADIKIGERAIVGGKFSDDGKSVTARRLTIQSQAKKE